MTDWMIKNHLALLLVITGAAAVLGLVPVWVKLIGAAMITYAVLKRKELRDECYEDEDIE